MVQTLSGVHGATTKICEKKLDGDGKEMMNVVDL